MRGVPKFVHDEHVIVSRDSALHEKLWGQHFCVTESEWDNAEDAWVYYGFSLNDGTWLVLAEDELEPLP